jgi:DNA (cytosine-5)-methyltransferase 1
MKLTVCELSAGVGGFRLGLEKSGWETVWANQYEPSTKNSMQLSVI